MHEKEFSYFPDGLVKDIQELGANNITYTSLFEQEGYKKPHAIIDHQFTLNQGVPSSSAEEHSYTYNDFNSITQITQTVLSTPTSNRTLDISYGVDQQRIKMEYASPTSPYASTTYYIGSANMEIRSNAWGRQRHPNTWDYLVMNPFGMGGANDITLRGYTFHVRETWFLHKNLSRTIPQFGKHLPHFSLINMNGRLYDYVLGRMLSPDTLIYPDKLCFVRAQSFNRYSYCWNNPLKYTDPSGEIVWMVPIVAAVVFGVGNLAVQAYNGEINSFGDGAKAFGAGAVAGFALGTGVGLGLTVPILGTAIKAAGWAYAGTTVLSGLSGLGHGITTGDWTRLENTGKIFAGNFYLDGNRSFGGQVLQGISRFSWELPQSTVGHGYSQLRNTFNSINRVDYFGGATFSTSIDENSNSRWGISIGNHINIQNNVNSFDIVNDPLLMHEYGHTFDSQIFGLSYLFAVGIPSLKSANGATQIQGQPKGVTTHDFKWYEMRANRHAKRYFGKYYGVDWENETYGSGTYETYFPTRNR